MRDRSAGVIAFVAIGILVLGLAVLARRLLSRWESRRRFGRGDVARWLRGGWHATRPILPALLVLLTMTAAGDLLRIHHWMTAQIASRSEWYAPALSVPERLREAANFPALERALLGSWRSILPFQWSFALGFLPLLLVAGNRRRFPFSAGRAVAQIWLALAVFLLAGWLYGFVSSNLLPVTHGLPTPLGGLIAFVSDFAGYPAFLMLLVGNVDTEAERRLEGGSPPALQTLLRVAALFAATLFAFTAQVGGRDPAYFRALLDGKAPTLLLTVVGWVLTAAGLALGFFASTALFPACSSPERGAGFARTTWRWWKRDGRFLVLMPLAVTLATWAVEFPIQIPLVGWRSPGSPGALLKSDVHVVIGSLGAFAGNLLVFMLLLGNWLEARERFAGADSPAPPR